MKHAPHHFLALVVYMHCFAVIGGVTIKFDTLQDVLIAENHLRNVGLSQFMDQVWADTIDAPGIHSKYWVDQFAQDEPNLKALETACRDFGREFATQLDSVAVDIHLHPEPKAEGARLDWLLKTANWIRKPGKFENYRIASRIEEAATMPLLRMIVNLEVSDEDIERAFARFWSVQDSAVMRAAILYEESRGALDLRAAAKAVQGMDDGFEHKWIEFHKRAYMHFNGRLLRYSRNRRELKDEPVEFTFPLDDYDSFHLDSLGWDLKLHKQVCVFRCEARNLRSLKEVFRFRKLVGMFPDVEIREGESPRRSYEAWYNSKFRQCWKQHKVYPGGAASYYLAAKDNSYVDEQTRRAISKQVVNAECR